MDNFCEIKKLENNKWNFHFVFMELDIEFDFTPNSCRWLSKQKQVLINANFNTVELYVKKTEPEIVYVKWHQCSSDIYGKMTKPDKYYAFELKFIDNDKFFS